MIFFSIGLPSNLGQWCDAIAAHLVRHGRGTIGVSAANTVEDLALALIRDGSSDLLVIIRQPVVRLQTEIVQSRRPLLIALCDPRSALSHLLTQPGCDVVAATRAVASGCAGMLALTAAPGALVLSGSVADDPAGAAAAIARHFGLAIGGGEITSIVAELATAGIEPEDTDDRALWEQLEDRERAIVTGALQPYVSHFAVGGELEPLVWERELFCLFEDPPGASLVPATRPVEISGRARVLIYGPGINLPPGTWSANIVLGFSAGAVGMSFVVEVYAGRQLNYTRLQPSRAQILEANLHFTIGASLDYPVEIRVLSENAAFDGRLALGRVTLTPHTAVRDEIQEYLAQMLPGED